MVGGRDSLGFEWAVDAVTVGARHRRDMGDLEGLASSIRERGLLQLPTVTPDGVLVCGARRLAAVKLLGWKTVNVWVRTGLSDKLAALMAERDDNTSLKLYTKAELADLYEELKKEIAADAARRQRATLFHDGRREGSDGVGNFPTPLDEATTGDSRVQAARMVGAPGAYKTLEKITAIRQVAADPARPQELRDQAGEGLAQVEAGGPVDPVFHRLRALIRVDDLERIAADPAETGQTREAAEAGAILLRKLQQEQGMGPAELDKTARAALDRVQTARLSKQPVKRGPAPASGPRRRSVRQFVWTWNEMRDWPKEYDQHAVAEQLTDQQWEQFTQSLADWQAFADQVQAIRDQIRQPA